MFHDPIRSFNNNFVEFSKIKTLQMKPIVEMERGRMDETWLR